MSLSDLIIERIRSTAASYTEGPAGLHDSRGDTYHAVNVKATTGSKTDEDLATDLAEDIIDALHINHATAVEYLVEPRITVRGLKTLCYARISTYLVV